MKTIPLIICAVILAAGTAFASPSIDIGEPGNQTYFNNTISLKVSSNESISTWKYNLDAGANVTFTPNVSVTVQQGAHNLTIYATNTSGTTNSSVVYFTSAYTIVTVYDEETGANVSSGILVKLLNSSSLVTIYSNNTDANGSVYLIAGSYATYKLQAGGPSTTDYTIIRNFDYVFDVPTETVTMKLVKSGTGSYATLQFIDSYYSTNLADVAVTWNKENIKLDEQTSDTNGYVTEYLIPNTFYVVDFSKTGYSTGSITQTFVAGVYAVYMVRTDLDVILDPKVIMYAYPSRKTLYKNSTVSFALDIWARDSDLESYGIVVGYDPDTIQNENIPYSSIKQLMTSGTNAGGDYIFSTKGVQMKNWKADTLYAGFYYVIEGVKKWRIYKYPIVEASGQSPYAIDVQAVLEETAAGFGFTDTEKAVKFFFLLLVAMISGGAGNKGGKLFGVMAMFMSMGFFIYWGVLDKWMMLIAVLVTGSLIVDKYGGLYE